MIRRVPGVVWGATAAFMLLLIAWSLLAPTGRAPDEAAHADLVLELASGASYPDYDGRHPSQAVVNVWIAHGLAGQSGGLTPESATDRGHRKDFEQWGGDEPTASLNQMPQHPPLYYWVTSSALRLERKLSPGSQPVSLDWEWHLLRLINVAMLTPLPVLAWAAASKLGTGDRAAIGAAFVPLAVPQLTHIGASINNDNLLILLAAVLAVLVASVLRGDLSRRTAASIAVVASLALLTKAFALALVPWVVLAYLSQAWKRREQLRHVLTVAMIAVLPAIVVGAWWPVHNLMRHGQAFPSSLDPAFATSPPGFTPDPIGYARDFVPSIIQRFWGDFGSFEAQLPLIVVASLTVLAFAAAVAALAPGRTDRGPQALLPRRVLLLFLAPLGLLLGAVTVHAYDLYQSSGKTPFIQGRYLFSAIIPFAVMVAIGLARLFRRWMPCVLVGVVTVVQLDGMYVALRTWWAEPAAPVKRSVAAMLAWSPWPQPVVAALAVLGLATWIFTASRCTRAAFETPPVTEDSRAPHAGADAQHDHRRSGSPPPGPIRP